MFDLVLSNPTSQNIIDVLNILKSKKGSKHLIIKNYDSTPDKNADASLLIFNIPQNTNLTMEFCNLNYNSIYSASEVFFSDSSLNDTNIECRTLKLKNCFAVSKIKVRKLYCTNTILQTTSIDFFSSFPDLDFEYSYLTTFNPIKYGIISTICTSINSPNIVQVTNNENKTFWYDVNTEQGVYENLPFYISDNNVYVKVGPKYVISESHKFIIKEIEFLSRQYYE